MRYDVRNCRILSKKEIASGMFDVTVEAGELARQAKPGQFAQIYVPGKTLRRPISICESNAEQETLRFVFQVRGEGTDLLSNIPQGETLDVFAPLGQGFSFDTKKQRAVFVGGGIGVPPLLGAAKQFKGEKTAILGFRSESAVILKQDFEAAGCSVQLTTDDGSAGHHGFVTDILQTLEAEIIFACGPTPMLKAVAAIAEKRGIACQVSLEERMACGIGACLGCAVTILRDGKEVYGHVCKDGPVFDAQQVVFA